MGLDVRTYGNIKLAENEEDAQTKALAVFNMDVDLPAVHSVEGIGDIQLVHPGDLSAPRSTRGLFNTDYQLIIDNTPPIVENETN